MQLDYTRDNLLTKQAKDLLTDFYLKDGETYQEAFARPAIAFSGGDMALAQRIYDYASKLWFMYASPVLSNAPSDNEVGAMPISCYLSYVPDSIYGQMDASYELAALSISGGGVGMHNGIRATSKKAPGPIPYMKTIDASIGYYKQSASRKGSVAYYMDVDHPDIREHINFRIPSGGDSARRADNRKSFHCAVNISNEFMQKVKNNEKYNLVCPHSKEVREEVSAREIWEMILNARALTGEPYLHFIDVSNDALPNEQKDKGLRVNGSNLCSEITLPTSESRTAVCCLSSVNLEKYDEWKDSSMIEDLVTFLDNVLSYFIKNAPKTMLKAINSARLERSIGIGAMGFHGYLMKNDVPFESGGFNSATQKNHIMFSNIKSKALAASEKLGKERGVCEVSSRRNAHLLAIAPNANSSIICNCTPSIEPINSNAFTHTTRAGTYLVKNKYLEKLLEEKAGEDTTLLESWWKKVIEDDGSVQNLDCLNQDEKRVYRTAFEIDQHWVVEHAEARQQYICQSQSVNLFFPAGSSRQYVNSVHLKAGSGKLKSLYYFRTKNKSKADTVTSIERVALKDWSDSEECVACQG